MIEYDTFHENLSEFGFALRLVNFAVTIVS